MRSLNCAVLVSSSVEPPTGSHAGSAGGDTPSLDLRSARDLVDSLRGLGHSARVIQVDDALEGTLAALAIDLCVLALHGNAGGTGHVQARLDRLGVPYTGPGARLVAGAYDKLLARETLARHNVPVPTCVELAGDGPDLQTAALLGWPCVLKPRLGSASDGLVHLASRAAVDASLAASGEFFQRPHLLERRLSGVEVQTVIVDGEVLGSMQVERGESERGRPCAVLSCPPELPRSVMTGVENLARLAASALGLGKAPTRVDTIVNLRHNERVLEVEPLPPLHRDGVVALVARAAGIRHAELVARTLAPALRLALRRGPVLSAPVAQLSL